MALDSHKQNPFPLLISALLAVIASGGSCFVTAVSARLATLESHEFVLVQTVAKIPEALKRIEDKVDRLQVEKDNARRSTTP